MSIRTEGLKKCSKKALAKHIDRIEKLSRRNARRLFGVVVQLRRIDPDNAVFTNDAMVLFNATELEQLDTYIEDLKTKKRGRDEQKK